MNILIEDTNIPAQTGWIDGNSNPVAEPAEHLLRRRLRIEPDTYSPIAGEIVYTPSGTVAECELSILRWCEWSQVLGKDYFWMVEQMRDYRDVFGYASLNDDTKKILLKHFSGGPGSDYIDPLFSQAEYDALYAQFELDLTDAFNHRDKLVYQKMRKRVYQGNPTKAQATKTADAIAFLRDNYIRDFFMSSAVDEIDGVIDFLNNDSNFQYRDIASADAGTSRYTISSFNINKVRKNLGSTVQIVGSTGGVNDGFFALEDWGRNGSDSWVEVSNIPDANAVDLGQVVLTGLKAFDGMSDAIRDECIEIYLHGG